MGHEFDGLQEKTKDRRGSQIEKALCDDDVVVVGIAGNRAMVVGLYRSIVAIYIGAILEQRVFEL